MSYNAVTPKLGDITNVRGCHYTSCIYMTLPIESTVAKVVEVSDTIISQYTDLCKLSSIYVFCYFPFGFEGRIWDLIVSVPDHCLSFYFITREYITVSTGTNTELLTIHEGINTETGNIRGCSQHGYSKGGEIA